jgi:hypothetical protein
VSQKKQRVTKLGSTKREPRDKEFKRAGFEGKK